MDRGAWWATVQQSMGSWRVGYDWATNTYFDVIINTVKFKSGYLFSICSTFARFFSYLLLDDLSIFRVMFFSPLVAYFISLVCFVVLVLGLQHDYMTWQFTYRWNSAALGIRLEKAMAPHSSTLAWKIPWTEEPGRLQSMGSWRVRHDRETSLWLFTFMRRRRKWQPTPVFLPGESQGRGSLVGCRLWGRIEWDMTEAT